MTSTQIDIEGHDAPERLCACGCKHSLEGMRKDAVWYSRACAVRWARENPGKSLLTAHSTNRARTLTRRKPSGAQVSYFKVIDAVAATLRAYGIHESRSVARTTVRRALPDRQRARLEQRQEGSLMPSSPATREGAREDRKLTTLELERRDRALKEVERLLRGETTLSTARGRRTYLAHLIALDALEPGKRDREATIADLRKGIAKPLCGDPAVLACREGGLVMPDREEAMMASDVRAWQALAEHLHDGLAFMRSCELSGESGADHSTVISALEAYEHRPDNPSAMANSGPPTATCGHSDDTAITELDDGSASHIVEPAGILNAPLSNAR